MIDFFGIFRIELVIKEVVDGREITGIVNADQEEGIVDGSSQLFIILVGDFILFKFIGEIEIFFLRKRIINKFRIVNAISDLVTTTWRPICGISISFSALFSAKAAGRTEKSRIIANEMVSMVLCFINSFFIRSSSNRFLYHPHCYDNG